MRTFLAARSLWTHLLVVRNSIPLAICQAKLSISLRIEPNGPHQISSFFYDCRQLRITTTQLLMMNMKRKTSTGSGGAAMPWPDSDNLNICVILTHRRSIDCTGWNFTIVTSITFTAIVSHRHSRMLVHSNTESSVDGLLKSTFLQHFRGM